LLAVALFSTVAGCGSAHRVSATSQHTLTTVSVNPATGSVQPGQTLQFSATGSYADGTTEVFTSNVNWTSSNTSVATIDASGKATGVAAGTATVTASSNGVTGTATLTVAVPSKTVTSIHLSPANASITAGATQQFSATATYNDGSTGDVSQNAAWSSSDSSIATVSAGGLADGIAAGSTIITASLNGASGTATLTVNPKAPKSIAVSPAGVNTTMGATQQLTATATYQDGSTGDVSSEVTWSVANSAVASVSASGQLAASAIGSTQITAALNGITATIPVAVKVDPAHAVNVATWHADNNRSGLNAGEVSLSPANVNPGKFGKMFSYEVDGYAYAEPLIVSNVTIAGQVHNVLYVATENDSVYAFDADAPGDGTPLWKVSLLQAGESPLTNAPIKPVEGITSTPVVDPSTNTLYVVSTQKASNAPGTFRLNALDLATGAQKFGGPVTLQASVPGTGKASVNGIVSLTTSCTQRAALLLANSTVYIGFGSCATGWLLAYDAQSLAQVGVFNASPNLDGEGEYASAGGIWMGGGGPAADTSGNIYAVTGNGPWDGQTAWADSVLKFNPKLQMLDYFTPQDYQYMDCADSDLAAGGLLLLPGTSQALAGGKMGKLYLVNTQNLGKEQSNDAGATQTLWFASDLVAPYPATCTDPSGDHTTQVNSYEIFGTAAYFNGAVYLGVTPTSATAPSGVRQFTYSGTLTPGPYTSPGIQQNTRGTTPFISANGTDNGIVWMIDTGQPIQNSGGNTPTPAVLRAYDAAQFPKELYNSAADATDLAGYGIKFSSPVVANGRVYISTGTDLPGVANPRGEIDVYGLK
jgi:uncharacterized protein YjdB